MTRRLTGRGGFVPPQGEEPAKKARVILLLRAHTFSRRASVEEGALDEHRGERSRFPRFLTRARCTDARSRASRASRRSSARAAGPFKKIRGAPTAHRVRTTSRPRALARPPRGIAPRARGRAGRFDGARSRPRRCGVGRTFASATATRRVRKMRRALFAGPRRTSGMGPKSGRSPSSSPATGRRWFWWTRRRKFGRWGGTSP